jgi:hypothetical protein
MEQITEKECRLCEETKPLDDFNKSICGKFGYANECKECRKEARKKLNFSRILDGNKLCNNCNTIKDVSEFSNDCKNSDGLRSTCKTCSINHIYNYGSTLDGFIKMLYYDLISNAKKRYISVNITIDDIKSQYNNQVGLCAMTRFKMTWIKHPNESETHINNKFNISVDRIDSNKGYTKDNIQLVCATANIIKNKLPQDKFIEICKKISKNKNLIN